MLYHVTGINAKGVVVRTAFTDSDSEKEDAILAMSERPEIVRIVVDIALPQR